MKLSDQITRYILEMLEIAESGEAKLKRNELADEMGCVPSQINYVLSSRFTPEHGFIVESKRGGGGYILVRKIDFGDKSSYVMHIVNSVGDKLDLSTADVILENMVRGNIISLKTAKLIGSALSTRAFSSIPPKNQDAVRATIMKQMLITVISFTSD